MNVPKDRGLIRPLVDREAESRLRDQRVAANRLEGLRRGVTVRRIVVTRHDHNLSLARHPDLRRSQDMASRMKGDLRLPDLDRLTERQGRQPDRLPDPLPQEGLPAFRAKILPHPTARMVRMGVCNHRLGDGLPRVDVKVARRTIEPGACFLQDIPFIKAHSLY